MAKSQQNETARIAVIAPGVTVQGVRCGEEGDVSRSAADHAIARGVAVGVGAVASSLDSEDAVAGEEE